MCVCRLCVCGSSSDRGIIVASCHCESSCSLVTLSPLTRHSQQGKTTITTFSPVTQHMQSHPMNELQQRYFLQKWPCVLHRYIRTQRCDVLLIVFPCSRPSLDSLLPFQNTLVEKFWRFPELSHLYVSQTKISLCLGCSVSISILHDRRMVYPGQRKSVSLCKGKLPFPIVASGLEANWISV